MDHKETTLCFDAIKNTARTSILDCMFFGIPFASEEFYSQLGYIRATKDGNKPFVEQLYLDSVSLLIYNLLELSFDAMHGVTGNIFEFECSSGHILLNTSINLTV